MLFGINVDSSDDRGGVIFVGGVRPRVPAPSFGMKPEGVSCPRMDLVSEEDRSLFPRLLENRRRIEAPMLEARLGRVSSFSKSISIEFWVLGYRTIPENGTADNLSISPGRLLDA